MSLFPAEAAKCKIVEVTSNRHEVKVTLENGVVFSVNSNSGYLHLHVCGVQLPMKVGNSPLQVETNNQLNIYYQQTGQ